MLNEDLIQSLADDCDPVRPLPHPASRAIAWFVISLGYVAIVVGYMSLRPDFSAKIADPQYAVEVASAFLTSIMAAAGAFCAGCPGRLIWERLAPLPFILLWIGALAVGGWRDVNAFGVAGLVAHSDIACLPSIFAISIPPAILILLMARQAAPIAPFVTAGLAALAATSLAAAALRLSFRQDAAVSICIWQFGSVILLSGVAALFGRKLLRWTMRDEFVAAFRQGYRR